MTKQNVNSCSNCGSENPIFEKNCRKCKHYLRASVVNIDLWTTIWNLFESPRKALTKVVYAEHKNFVSFLLVFLGIKIFSTSMIIQSAYNLIIPNTQNFLYNISLLVSIYIVTILLFTKILTITINIKNKTRYKDNLAIIVYSFIPIIFSLFFLTPVEYGIFGVHWFIYNPSPFIIKINLANVLSGIEVLMCIWSVIILFQGIFLQSDSKLFSAITIFILFLLLISEIIFIPFILL